MQTCKLKNENWKTKIKFYRICYWTKSYKTFFPCFLQSVSQDTLCTMIRQGWHMLPAFCQFHQHFTCTYFVRIFCQSQNVTRKSCQNEVCTKNLYIKTLFLEKKSYKTYILSKILSATFVTNQFNFLAQKSHFCVIF